MQVRKLEGLSVNLNKKVAAYCRVSTALPEQQESYEMQKRYYHNMILSNREWEYIGIYADEGRTGINAKNRPDFIRMMTDARNGKIDIILTKSISRFARNVVDCQRYVKDLKSRGIEVRFEREGISSMDASADFIFSILATVAQEESRSIGENVRWRYEKNFEQGKYRMGSNRLLGFDMNNEGNLVPNEDAWIIRRIFSHYLAGMNFSQIAAELDKVGAKRLRSDKPFTADRIRRMLQNEAYVGDRILQKAAPRDFLTKRPKKNISYTSYYVRNAHEGIVDRASWDKVKEKLDIDIANRNKGIVTNCTKTHFLYGKVFCAQCGAPYTRRTITDRKGEHYKVWNCRERQKGKLGNGCKNPTVREETLLEEVATALGIKRFEREAFEQYVEQIIISMDSIHVEVKTNIL